MALVTLSSFSSSSVSIVSTIYVKMSGGLGTSSTVYSSSSGEVIGGPVTHNVESFSHYTTCRNPGELVEGIFTYGSTITLLIWSLQYMWFFPPEFIRLMFLVMLCSRRPSPTPFCYCRGV